MNKDYEIVAKQKTDKYIGVKFNMVTIIEYFGVSEIRYGNKKIKRIPIIKVRCDCGVVKNMLLDNVIRGLSKNCGCVRDNKGRIRLTKHGCASKSNWTREHKAWCRMFSRCYDKNGKTYHHYGGRGIVVCERWHDFKNFISDMGMMPPDKNSIDRFPNKDGNYEANNCRWANTYDQARNRNNNVYVTVNGVKMVARDAERLLGLPRDTIQRRLKAGCTENDAINLPRYYRNKKQINE